jgi:ribA/ribD-fused uncharacterized protein
MSQPIGQQYVMQPIYHLDWLREKTKHGHPVTFLYFWGHANPQQKVVGNFCFSQWYPSPFTVDGATYLTAEHWMMAQKAKLFGDHSILAKIMLCQKPAEAKALGRKVANYDDGHWNEKKHEIVVLGNCHKFGQHPLMGAYLRKTGDSVLVEASPVDSVWGIGLAQDHPDAGSVTTWRGENLLGFALMEVRDWLKDH